MIHRDEPEPDRVTARGGRRRRRGRRVPRRRSACRARPAGRVRCCCGVGSIEARHPARPADCSTTPRHAHQTEVLDDHRRRTEAGPVLHTDITFLDVRRSDLDDPTSPTKAEVAGALPSHTSAATDRWGQGPPPCGTRLQRRRSPGLSALPLTCSHGIRVSRVLSGREG
jgi:hypothetical protein